LFTTVFVPSPETELLNVDEQDSALFITVFVPSPETELLNVDEQDSVLFTAVFVPSPETELSSICMLGVSILSLFLRMLELF
jgi:hypothetical protein